ncbi:DNA-binding protein, partial [Bacillus thuringiensis]
ELTEKENLIKMVKEKYFENQTEKSHS